LFAGGFFFADGYADILLPIAFRHPADRFAQSGAIPVPAVAGAARVPYILAFKNDKELPVSSCVPSGVEP